MYTKKIKTFIIIVLLSSCMVYQVNSFQTDKNGIHFFTTEDCSSGHGKCQDCIFQYMCLKCVSEKCCPKYCTSCSKNTKCETCLQGFKMQKKIPYWAFCVNTDPEIDLNRNKIDPSKCRQGYYLHPQINFCQKCPTLNCQTCNNQNAKECLTCLPGYYLQDQKCIFRQQKIIQTEINPEQNNNKSILDLLTEKVINPPNKNGNLNLNFQNPITSTTTPKSDQDQQTYYIIVFAIGITVGFCLACILIKIYFCIKKRCQNLHRRFKNRSKKNQKETKKPLKNEKQLNSITETPNINDQQKQFAQIKEQQSKVDLDSDSEQIDTISLNKKQIITEDKS